MFLSATTITITIIIHVYIFIVSTQNCSIYPSSSLPLQVYAHETAFDGTSNILYLFGGMSTVYLLGGAITGTDHLNSIYKWQLHENIWSQLSINTPNNMFYSTVNNAVTINDIVYFIGMDDDSYNSGEVYLFDLRTAQWLSNTAINSPKHPSITGCLTQNTTHIFMVGGQISPTNYSDQLQTYHVSNNLWSTETINIAPIQNNGWLQGFCHSVDVNLYVFGGGLTENDAINTIFKYNPTDGWISIGTLPNALCCGSAAYHQASGAIYIVGGYAETVSVFDVNTESITDSWMTTSSRAYAAIEIINETLYIFGGYNGKSLSIIETCTIPKSEITTTTLEPTTSEPTTLDPTTSKSVTVNSTTINPETLEATAPNTTILEASTTATLNLSTYDATTSISTSLEPDSTINSVLITSIINWSTSYIITNIETTARNIERVNEDTDIALLYAFVALILVCLFCSACVLVLVLLKHRKKTQIDAQNNMNMAKVYDNAPKNKKNEVNIVLQMHTITRGKVTKVHDMKLNDDQQEEGYERHNADDAQKITIEGYEDVNGPQIISDASETTKGDIIDEQDIYTRGAFDI